MATSIARIETDLFLVPLATALTDSTHGVMADFELIVVRVTDSDGAMGLGVHLHRQPRWRRGGLHGRA